MPRGAKRPPAEVSPQWSPEQDAAAVPLRNGPTPSLPGDLAAERTAESERSAQATVHKSMVRFGVQGLQFNAMGYANNPDSSAMRHWKSL